MTVKKSFEEINEKIKRGKAVVVTAEEMIHIAAEEGTKKAAEKVDVVTTGTFSAMCSSGAFINFGHTKPRIKADKVWLNNVPAYAALAAVDIYIGATEPQEDDPRNKIYPGLFKYGGGHVIHDLIAGKKVLLRVKAYGTDCYPSKGFEREITLNELTDAWLYDPRNCYQNYNCAVNLSKRLIYTYMGVLKPELGNATYCSAGQLSPLLNDPYLRTIGTGTRIFLGGGIGYVTGAGTQHDPKIRIANDGSLHGGGATLAVRGDMKLMKPEWVRGASFQGYGCSLIVGIGIPIPVLDEEMAACTAIKDDDIYTQIVDYGKSYPELEPGSLGEVNYAQLKSGKIEVLGKEVPTSPISSYLKAKEIAEILKSWIRSGKFLLGIPQEKLPVNVEESSGNHRKISGATVS